MTTELNAILNEAIPRWAELTGTKLGTNKYSFTIGSNSEFQEYDLQRYIDTLNIARTVDMSGATAILILRGLFEAYVKERSFSAHTLLFGSKDVDSVIDRLRSFQSLIDQPPCRDAVEDFRVSLRNSATHYGYDLGKLKKLLADERPMGNLRLAAHRSIEDLAVHQFSQGVPSPTPLQYNREIFEFSSINSFVHALRRQAVSGITLALVRGGDVYKSYFVLGLRNGDTITVLTDFQEGEHPEYHNMTRRPDRRLEERSRQHWFPYHLLDLDPVKHRQLRDKTALVRIDQRPTAIEEIANLDPAEFVWLILLFDLIRTKFERNDFKTPEVSYTADMIVNPHALFDGNTALVVSGQYQPLVLPAMTAKDATAELAGSERAIGHNAWMEERYRDRVPDVMLDVVGDRKALEVGRIVNKLLPHASDVEAGGMTVSRRPRRGGGFQWLTDYRVEPVQLMALDPTYFGTKKDIERTRGWYARQNLIQGVQRHASAEFAAKADLIVSWYRKRIERNMAFIWKAVATGTLVAPCARWTSDYERARKTGGNHEPFPNQEDEKLHWTKENILSQKQAPKYDPFRKRGCVEFGGWNNDRGYNVCALDPPTRATVFTSIDPDNPRALALLLGIPERKIPWPLRHWITREPYTGNSLLRRIDPQDSRLDNPWRHLDLSLSISLSKREYNRICKEHGVAPRKLAA